MQDGAPSTRQADSAKAAPRSWRRWLVPRFSLRTILIVITLACLVLGLPISRAERQREAANKLRKLDCYWEFELEPEWLKKLPPYVRNFRDRHYFRSIAKVTVNGRARNSLDTIFQLIGQIDRVQSIDTSSAPVTHEHLAHIAHLRNVRSLRLSHRLLDDGALSNLRNWTRLEELLIPTAGITGHGVAHLKRNSRLKRIDLSNTFVGDEIAEVISAFPRLEGLELWHTDITSAGFARFPDFREVTWVDLHDTQVDDAVVNKLARFPKLTGIDLSHTRITDFTGRTIARWPVVDVRLNNTAITDATLKALTDTSTLDSLEVRNTKATLFGVRRLHTLPKIGSVSFFYKEPFRKNELRALAGKKASPIPGIAISKHLSRAEWELIAKLPFLTGGPALSRAGAAGVNRKSRASARSHLSVDGSNCDDEVLEVLAAHAAFSSISLHGCAIGKRGLAALAKMPTLDYISLAKTPVTAEDFAVFQGHQHLVGVNISGSKLGDDAIPILLSMPQCRSVDITKDQISYGALQELHKHLRDFHVVIDDRTMRWSELGDHSGVHGYLFLPRALPLTEDLVARIGDQTDVRTLVLEEQTINDATWARFAALKGLAWISIRGQGVTDKTMEQLATREPLHSLKLIDCRVTADGLGKLARLPNLRYLHLVDLDIKDDDLQFLDQMPHLEGLTLSGTQVTDASLPRIANLANLRFLELNGRNVTPALVRDAVAGIKLANLYVGGSFLSDISLRYLQGQHDLKATSIDLRGPCFDDKVLAKLADYLWLREVELNNSAAGDATLASMSELTDLQVVQLKGTQITDDGLRHMANWKHLRQLDLSQTAITDKGLEQVIGLPQLRKIWAHGTRVSPEAIEALRDKHPWVTIVVDRARY